MNCRHKHLVLEFDLIRKNNLFVVLLLFNLSSFTKQDNTCLLNLIHPTFEI